MNLSQTIRRFSELKSNKLLTVGESLIADLIQSALKGTSYWLSGSQAMKAETMRSLIDGFGRWIILKSNQKSADPSTPDYNYGIFYSGFHKFANMGLLLPGFGFGISGLYSVFFSLSSLFSASSLPVLAFSPLSLSVFSN